MQCTPRELQHVLDVIHGWKYDFDDENIEQIKTMQDIIDLLARPEYIENAESVEDETGENYFEIVFNI